MRLLLTQQEISMTDTLIDTTSPLSLDTSAAEIAAINAELEGMDAAGRIARALKMLPGNAILSSSFGAQSAVMLHLLTKAMPDIPVVLTDTGYLFPET